MPTVLISVNINFSQCVLQNFKSEGGMLPLGGVRRNTQIGGALDLPRMIRQLGSIGSAVGISSGNVNVYFLEMACFEILVYVHLVHFSVSACVVEAPLETVIKVYLQEMTLKYQC